MEVSSVLLSSLYKQSYGRLNQLPVNQQPPVEDSTANGLFSISLNLTQRNSLIYWASPLENKKVESGSSIYGLFKTDSHLQCPGKLFVGSASKALHCCVYILPRL